MTSLRPALAAVTLGVVAACAALPPAPEPVAAPATAPSLVPFSPNLRAVPGPASGAAGGFSYEVVPIPSPRIEPSPAAPGRPGYRIEAFEAGNITEGMASNQLIVTDDDDAKVAKLYAKYGAREIWREIITDLAGQAHVLPMREAWIPTPEHQDLSDLPRLAADAGLAGHYRFHTFSGAVLFLTWLRMQADRELPTKVTPNYAMAGYFEPGRYGAGKDCLDSLAGVPQRAVQALVDAKWQGRDLTLSVVADVPWFSGTGRPSVYGCGTVVGNRLEVRLFYVEDQPQGIEVCPYALPVVFKDVPPGSYDVIEAQTGRKLTTIDPQEGDRDFGYVRPACAI